MPKHPNADRGGAQNGGRASPLAPPRPGKRPPPLRVPPPRPSAPAAAPPAAAPDPEDLRATQKREKDDEGITQKNDQESLKATQKRDMARVRPKPEGAIEITHVGYVYALGYTSDRYVVWDRRGDGPAVRSFPRGADGWIEAWQEFTALEPSASDISIPDAF